jgi:hypothetical protein
MLYLRFHDGAVVCAEHRGRRPECCGWHGGEGSRLLAGTELDAHMRLIGSHGEPCEDCAKDRYAAMRMHPAGKAAV